MSLKHKSDHVALLLKTLHCDLSYLELNLKHFHGLYTLIWMGLWLLLHPISYNFHPCLLLQPHETVIFLYHTKLIPALWHFNLLTFLLGLNAFHPNHDLVLELIQTYTQGAHITS